MKIIKDSAIIFALIIGIAFSGEDASDVENYLNDSYSHFDAYSKEEHSKIKICMRAYMQKIASNRGNAKQASKAYNKNKGKLFLKMAKLSKGKSIMEILEYYGTPCFSGKYPKDEDLKNKYKGDYPLVLDYDVYLGAICRFIFNSEGMVVDIEESERYVPI